MKTDKHDHVQKSANSRHAAPQGPQASRTSANTAAHTAVPNRRRRKGSGGTVILVAIIALFAVLAALVMGLLFYEPSFGQDDHPLDSDDMSGVILTDNSGNTVDEIVRDSERVNFLVMGKDRWAFNTDVIMLLSYDVKNGKISLMQFPRDTYFDIGQSNCKINAALALFYNMRRREGLSDSDAYKAAMMDMEKALEDVFRITIDYYAIMDLNGFVNIIDALGGVELDVPARMYYVDDVQKLKIDLKPGLQTLSGAQAEQFVRYRNGYIEGDVGRVDAQKLFISACIAQVKKNFNVSTISAITEQVLKYVTTDIPLKDLVYYAKSALSVDLSAITMMTLPGIQCRQYNDSGTWYYVAYRDATVAALNKYFNSYNFEITSAIFDRDDVLYDGSGTYMHSIYLTANADEESYTADKTDDIYIYRYNSATTTTTKVTTADTEEPVEPDVTNVTDETTVTDMIDTTNAIDGTADSNEADTTAPDESDGVIHTGESAVSDVAEDTVPGGSDGDVADATTVETADEEPAQTAQIETADVSIEPSTSD